MTATECGGVPGQAPAAVESADEVNEQSQTVARLESIRRRAAPSRLDPPFYLRRRDPRDLSATGAVDVGQWGSYDAADLGLGCAHDENCPARRAESVA